MLPQRHIQFTMCREGFAQKEQGETLPLHLSSVLTEPYKSRTFWLVQDIDTVFHPPAFSHYYNLGKFREIRLISAENIVKKCLDPKEKQICLIYKILKKLV